MFDEDIKTTQKHTKLKESISEVNAQFTLYDAVAQIRLYIVRLNELVPCFHLLG